jgi:hypothetical protein
MRSRPKWALFSRTILLNLALLLVSVNELIPVVTAYREVVPIPDVWLKRALFAGALANIILRRLSSGPVAFRLRRVQRIDKPADARSAPVTGWDGDPGWAGDDEAEEGQR